MHLQLIVIHLHALMLAKILEIAPNFILLVIVFHNGTMLFVIEVLIEPLLTHLARTWNNRGPP